MPQADEEARTFLQERLVVLSGLMCWAFAFLLLSVWFLYYQYPQITPVQETLVLFLSDNGPFLSYGSHAGSAGHLREGKLTTFEGGVRVPAIARWPGTVPAKRVCDDPGMTIDLLPALCGLAGAKLPIAGKPAEGERNVIDAIRSTLRKAL